MGVSCRNRIFHFKKFRCDSIAHLPQLPTEFLGISGKTLGVLSQAVFMLAVALLPLWARSGPGKRPGVVSGFCVTVAIVAFVGLTLWGTWPPPPLLAITVCAAVVLFYILIFGERRRIRRARCGRWGEP